MNTALEENIEGPGSPDSVERLPISLVTQEFFPARGGVGAYVYELASAASNLGYDVRVLAPGHPRWRELNLPVKLEAISRAPLLDDWWYFPAATAYLLANRRKLRTQTLHLCQQAPLRVMMVLRLLGLVRPKRLIITLHGSELMQLTSSRIGGRWLLGKLLESSDRVAVLSRWVEGELLRHYPAMVGKVVVAPGAPGTARLNSDGGTRAQGDRITVLTVGRVHPRKGQHAVLKALARLAAGQRERIRYVIVGPTIDRTYERALTDLATATGLEVEFAGDVDDIALAHLYAEADIFALTSDRRRYSVEGFGIAFLEASAYGLPVVGYRTGGVEDTVRHGLTGLLIEPGNIDGVAAALNDLIEDPALREKLGSNGRSWAREFSWKRCASLVYGDFP